MSRMIDQGPQLVPPSMRAVYYQNVAVRRVRGW